jgi:beta-lactam-binding protein with PASTA domain
LAENDDAMPDLIGSTKREAIGILGKNNIEFRIIGSGCVVEQTPKSGEKLDPGEVCLIECGWNK